MNTNAGYNTFGVHFVLRTSRASDDDKFPVYARIVVNATRCEFSMKQSLSKADWNFGKGEAKTRNAELRAFNSYMQEMQGKIHRHYRDLQLEDEPLTATAVKAAFLGIEKEPAISYSLLWLVSQRICTGLLPTYTRAQPYQDIFSVNVSNPDILVTETDRLGGNTTIINRFPFCFENGPILASPA